MRFMLFAALVIVALMHTTTSLAQVTSNSLERIDFQLNKQRNGKITLELSEPHIALDIEKTAQGLSIKVFDTAIDAEQLKRFDVADFASSVQMLELFQHGDDIELTAQIEGAFSYHYQLNDHLLEVIVQSVEPNKDQELSLPAKNMSINFQDVPVRNVLQLIAQYNGFNLVMADTVSGNISLRLDEVPWTQILDVILQVKGLAKRADGNVVIVAPLAEIEQREQLRLEQARLESERVGFQSQIIKVNFANASDIAELVGGEGVTGMLSERGTVRVDERTNSLLIRDFSTNIDAVREIIAALDVPIKQVQIEARIVTISEGNLDELGVRWSVNSNDGRLGASLEGNFDQRNQSQLLDANGSLLPDVDISELLNVNLAAAAANSSTIAFQVAKLGSSTLLDLELSALQRESKAEVISSPRLITTNKQPAYIEQGTEIPYLEAASSGATSVSFKKAVLSLKVTPQITPDNRLILDLNVTQDRPGEVLKTGTGEAVSINTQRIGTQVLVENGETIVLGGIYQRSVTDTVDKVPLLGDLPLLGALFRRSYQQLGKSELLIFVTPKVVVH
ncbi:type IV pilus secretin PilQ [Vibrio ponticus]|uniref:Type IV pilus secretin PilQ n=2 Tax=Vibrio ponticus TaxID=265668 RepID=A0A3N3E6Q3_9VIBR|nr:type IV pilus secretin PilQ [Vibrio ponticus]ROV62411.1 type IV pilus secretin PilQ [Vibrio ponticus]